MNIFYEADLPTHHFSDEFRFGDSSNKKLMSGLLVMVSLLCVLFVIGRTLRSLKARS